jgi:hypothetical protein
MSGLMPPNALVRNATGPVHDPQNTVAHQSTGRMVQYWLSDAGGVVW